METTLNERLNKIASKRAEMDSMAAAKQRSREETIAKYARDIKSLAPRIKELLEIARALRSNGISLGPQYRTICGSYRDSFVTEGINHNLGFYQNYKTGSIIGIGIEGGGYCGRDLAVDEDGDMVVRIDPGYQSYQYDGYWDYCHKCKVFLEGFEKFEQRVNDYVDNL